MYSSRVPSNLPASPGSYRISLLVGILHISIDRDRLHSFVHNKIIENLVCLGRLNLLVTCAPFIFVLTKNRPVQFSYALAQSFSCGNDCPECIVSPWANLLYANSHRFEWDEHFTNIRDSLNYSKETFVCGHRPVFHLVLDLHARISLPSLHKDDICPKTCNHNRRGRNNPLHYLNDILNVVWWLCCTHCSVAFSTILTSSSVNP